jgi:hypothetical protein
MKSTNLDTDGDGILRKPHRGTAEQYIANKLAPMQSRCYFIGPQSMDFVEGRVSPAGCTVLSFKLRRTWFDFGRWITVLLHDRGVWSLAPWGVKGAGGNSSRTVFLNSIASRCPF